MKCREFWNEQAMTFFLSTACIGLAMGVIGVIFAPEQRFGYEAFFAPPIFGLLSTLLGVATYSRRELTPRQVMVRKALNLLLVELMIFALNYVNGAYQSGAAAAIAVAVSVLLIFIAVDLLHWLNDSRSAREFNRALECFQHKEREEDQKK